MEKYCQMFSFFSYTTLKDLTTFEYAIYVHGDPLPYTTELLDVVIISYYVH